jgi:hypothetical protein
LGDAVTQRERDRDRDRDRETERNMEGGERRNKFSGKRKRGSSGGEQKKVARRWDSGLAWKDVTPSESISLLLGSDEGGIRFSKTRYTTVGSPNGPFH